MERCRGDVVCSNLAIPPGEYLAEVIAELGLTTEELARCMELPAEETIGLCRGAKAITLEIATRLEKAVGVPAHIWIGLELEYRLALAWIGGSGSKCRTPG